MESNVHGLLWLFPCHIHCCFTPRPSFLELLLGGEGAQWGHQCRTIPVWPGCLQDMTLAQGCSIYLGHSVKRWCALRLLLLRLSPLLICGTWNQSTDLIPFLSCIKWTMKAPTWSSFYYISLEIHRGAPDHRLSRTNCNLPSQGGLLTFSCD